MLHRVVFEQIHKAQKALFRVTEFSVQSDHVHLLVEADDAQALVRGVQGLAIRIARAVNRRLGRRGKLWGDRFHLRELATVREIRNALIYVLRNGNKHRGMVSPDIDPCSSAGWFEGFLDERTGEAKPPLYIEPSPVQAAQTWLGTVGWRRYGWLAPSELPVSARRS